MNFALCNAQRNCPNALCMNISHFFENIKVIHDYEY